MRIQELEDITIPFDFIFFFHKAMALVREYDILHGDIIFLDGVYNLIGFNLQYPWIIGSL